MTRIAAGHRITANIITACPFRLADMSIAQIRTWIRHSDLDSLEQLVLDGHGEKLVNENASDSKIRAFIKGVPSYMVE